MVRQNHFGKGFIGPIHRRIIVCIPFCQYRLYQPGYIGPGRDERALDLLSKVSRKEQGRIRTMLANLGLNETLKQTLKVFKCRGENQVKLADLLIREYELLILDEPTNHLDLYTMEQLEEALRNMKAPYYS